MSSSLSLFLLATISALLYVEAGRVGGIIPTIFTIFGYPLTVPRMGTVERAINVDKKEKTRVSTRKEGRIETILTLTYVATSDL